jgi:hypothetical protein
MRQSFSVELELAAVSALPVEGKPTKQYPRPMTHLRASNMTPITCCPNIRMLWPKYLGIIQIDSGINIFDSRCEARKAYGSGVPEIREYEQTN